MDELNPCLQCGGKAEPYECHSGFSIFCPACDTGIIDSNWTESKAVEIWNTRVDGWISVEDNLPFSAKGQWSQPVIAMSDVGLIYKLSYFNGDDSGCWQRTSAFAESASKIVTHWMPLPAPPKAEK